ncbi:hypothetical protein SAMN04488029_0405 [Reichenbachiella faecimaris]|uniref:Superfamily II DNA or RNA helicase n=1 Tax=Reichenbachiella faecimaris TaxID=692418 RepID=A0A1W2G5X7_REIFA|nr:DEAD/DEAH box helicase [Reichenbachiella faecimaris]SMD32067.1 hypothetical protein SAMN04488029_0405 [Reichenbachiella faecimaris]
MNSLKPSADQLGLYKALFKVREDVFAIRWEKGNKKGYSPAYHYDPYLYKLHKMKGGSFANFTEKSYLKLDDYQLKKHFSGEQHIGGYPLLEDNTSRFIAADFDGKKWKEESLAFLELCSENGIPSYLERSQSGNGAHVWVFIDKNYPAVRSRKVMITLLEQTGAFSAFDKSSSFDRLFPNQNFHSGRGLGNLIALPLYGNSLLKGNSWFINPVTFEPFEDQLGFLSSIRRIDALVLDKLYDKFTNEAGKSTFSDSSSKLEINLGSSIHINRTSLTLPLIDFLKEELNVGNSEYFVKKKSGKNTWGTERYFKLIEEKEFELIIPRGFTGKLIRHFKANEIDYEFNDLRKLKKKVTFQSSIELLAHQKPIISSSGNKDFGIIVAPPGAGKTVIGLKIIVDKQQPALIIVHRKQLLDQWVERIQAFLNIPKKEIGIIGSSKNRVGEKITVAIIQSLSKQIEIKPELKNHFGTLIIDECHHIPAKTYSNTISKLTPYYQYGLTATPFRKHSDGKLIFIHLGEIIGEIKVSEIENFKRARIVIRTTGFDFPFDPKTDEFEVLSKALVHDTTRNRLILNDVINELKQGFKSIIITERKEHIDTLHQFLKQSYEVVTLSGDDSSKSRNEKRERLKKGDYQALITTGQYFGEGSDLQNVSRLFLAYPFSFKGKLIQYIGRVQRSEVTPVIYDYHDHKIGYLHRLFLKRNVHYRNLDRQASLFDDSTEQPPLNKDLIIDRDVKVSFDELEFQYGGISFRHFIKETKTELDFEIENLDIRPEFNILKPYFSKVLKLKYVSVEIHAEFQDHILQAQSAESNDLLKINREVIDSVKFHFVKKSFLKKNAEITDEETKQKDLEALYGSGKDLLDDLLDKHNVKHGRQLKYLASKHGFGILKLRFVLSPFSFVFLISGNTKFHIVLETLDTEEATYIWHISKDRIILKSRLEEVDRHIRVIREKGRQSFLEQAPSYFSKILHDYKDDRKGFVIWKDQLEERLS